jgi:hypothetical protein
VGLLGAGVGGVEHLHVHTECGGSLSIFFSHISPLPQFKCCGAGNYSDWENVPGIAKNQVPDSCCIKVTRGCGTDFKVEAINQKVGRRLTVWDLGNLGNISGG